MLEQELLQGLELGLVRELELEQLPGQEREHLAQWLVPLAEMILPPLFLQIFGNLPIRPDLRYLLQRFSKFSYMMS
ncbi:MAG: hypothetical protein ACR65R_08615 [Methylomicrobium sp.]